MHNLLFMAFEKRALLLISHGFYTTRAEYVDNVVHSLTKPAMHQNLLIKRLKLTIFLIAVLSSLSVSLAVKIQRLRMIPKCKFLRGKLLSGRDHGRLYTIVPPSTLFQAGKAITNLKTKTVTLTDESS